MNKWFENFIDSFNYCNSKRITEKQFNIFAKYLKEDKNNFSKYAITFSGVVNGKNIKAIKHFCYNNYVKYFVTIKVDTTREKEEIKKQLKELNGKINKLIDNNASDEEIDKLELLENELFNKYNSL